MYTSQINLCRSHLVYHVGEATYSRNLLSITIVVWHHSEVRHRRSRLTHYYGSELPSRCSALIRYYHELTNRRSQSTNRHGQSSDPRRSISS